MGGGDEVSHSKGPLSWYEQSAFPFCMLGHTEPLSLVCCGKHGALLGGCLGLQLPQVPLLRAQGPTFVVFNFMVSQFMSQGILISNLYHFR